MSTGQSPSLRAVRCHLCSPPAEAFGRLFAPYAEVALLTAKPRYVRELLHGAQEFLANAGVTCPQEITTASIRSHLAALRQQGLKETTIRGRKCTLSRFCDFLVEQGLLAANPARPIRLRRPYLPPPVLLPRSSFRAVLRRTRGPVHAAIATAGISGLRLSEIVKLAPAEVLSAALLVTEPKGRRWRLVPMPPSLGRLLRRVRPVDQLHLFPRWCTATYCQKLSRATTGLAGFRSRPGHSVGRLWHALRAYAAMTKARAGIGPLQLMAEMGWEDWRVAMRYIQLAALTAPYGPAGQGPGGPSVPARQLPSVPAAGARTTVTDRRRQTPPIESAASA